MVLTHAIDPTPAAVIINVASAIARARPSAKTLRGSDSVASLQHSPRQNRLLAALPDAEYERLLSHLELVSLPLKWSVYGAHDLQKYLYFLTEGIVSRFYVMENGATAEFSSTGSDGAVGIAAFLGGESTSSHSSVVSAGYAYRVRSDWVRGEFARGGRLPHLLLRYFMAISVQTGQTAACNRYHSIRQQLCSLILLEADRLHSNELRVTQELLADKLGVRRESVTEAACYLQSERLIGYSRGRIVVLDRARLTAEACECYAVVKREHEKVLPDCVYHA